MTARALWRIALGLGAALAVACSEPTSGPAPVVWGRQACDHCAMAITDPRHAAQIRVGPHDVKRFDDFGCAVLWLAANGDLAAAQEFWVMGSVPIDSGDLPWVDARRAAFRSGMRTPMAYGFDAIAAAEPGAIDFEAARAAVLATRRERGAHGGP